MPSLKRLRYVNFVGVVYKENLCLASKKYYLPIFSLAHHETAFKSLLIS